MIERQMVVIKWSTFISNIEPDHNSSMRTVETAHIPLFSNMPQLNITLLRHARKMYAELPLRGIVPSQISFSARAKAYGDVRQGVAI